MDFINKQNNLPFAFLDFIEYRFQTFLKFATILRTCYQCSHIQRKDFLIL